MKVSDFILDFLAAHGAKYVFGVTGGMISPLFDAFHGRTDIRYICTQHEQAAAMAADAYARFAGLGCAIATSGPGATNLITGIGCSMFDSIPVILITGNVNTKEQKGTSGIRQRGFQETDIVSIIKPITKLARQVNDPKDIQWALEAALWNATSGRPGPVLLDIPINVQQAEIEPEKLMHFPAERPVQLDISRQVAETVELIANARRPIVIYGAGCRNYRAELLEFLQKTGIPCLPSWAALDLIPHDHPLFVSQFGVYGARAGNLAVQNADLLIAIGTRLDTRMTGNPQTFAPKAVKVVCDIDIHEATKNGAPDVLVLSDAGEFLRAMNTTLLPGISQWETELHGIRDFDSWKSRIDAWKRKYPLPSNKYPMFPSLNSDKIQPLDFIRQLSDALPDDAIIVADSGANLAWVQQAFRVRGTQRLFSAYGYSPMGYALPAAIGAYFATGKSIVAVCGDGAMQINIQELQTLAHYHIPVKVFILNNRSYGIIKQMQEELYDGRYEATDEAGGYSVPDFGDVAEAYKLPNLKLEYFELLEAELEVALSGNNGIYDVIIDPAARIFPKTRFGQPLENQYPFLPPDEVAENMRDE